MAPSRTASKTKSKKAAKVVYTRAPRQPGLTRGQVKDGQWRVEALVGKRYLDDTLQYLVRWDGIFNGPPGSLTAKEKWENDDDIHGAMTQRYDNDVFRAHWPRPVPEVERVVSATTVESEGEEEEEEEESQSESESESESGSEWEPDSEDSASDSEGD
jgi:hypothetical protein